MRGRDQSIPLQKTFNLVYKTSLFASEYRSRILYFLTEQREVQCIELQHAPPSLIKHTPARLGGACCSSINGGCAGTHFKFCYATGAPFEGAMRDRGQSIPLQKTFNLVYKTSLFASELAKVAIFSERTDLEKSSFLENLKKKHFLLRH